MKKVLIAIDYNPCAQKVAETGYKYARSMNAEICIVHAIADIAYYAMEYSPVMGYQGGYTAGTMELMDDIKKEAEVFLAASVKHLGDNSIKTIVLDGETPGSILDYCRDSKADLLVMGSHRHTGIDRLFLPDVALYVVRHSTIPLFIVPTPGK